MPLSLPVVDVPVALSVVFVPVVERSPIVPVDVVPVVDWSSVVVVAPGVGVVVCGCAMVAAAVNRAEAVNKETVVGMRIVCTPCT